MDHEEFKAFQIRMDGEISSGLTRVVLDDLSPGNVLIRSAFAGVNYKDALATTPHGNVIRHFPRIGGSDASGWVAASTDPRFKEGDKVVVCGRGFGTEHDGGFAELIRVPADWVVKIPSAMSLRDAAGLGIAGYTAALAVVLLHEAGLRPELGRVFVNGATGAVSGMGIEMLASLGYQVTAASSKSGANSYLEALGADEILDASMADSGKPLEKARWAAALDALGGQDLSFLLRSLKPRGCVASFGNVKGNEVNMSVLPFILRGVKLIGVNVTYYMDREVELWDRLASDLNPARMLADVRSISLEELPGHLERMLEGRTTGRTVVAFPA